MAGKLYGVGVGPGDPELLTIKAARIISECRYIAVPHSKSGRQLALEICKAYLKNQTIIHIDAPMTYDEQKIKLSYEQSSKELAKILQCGEDIVFLTLGDPSVYSTYTYVQKMVAAMGFETIWIPGVPSFCAAAAYAGIPLCEKDEALHIIPASHAGLEDEELFFGNAVFMKSGKKLQGLIEKLKEQNKLGKCIVVENVGLENQRTIEDLNNLPDDMGYFSLVIYKEGL